MTKFALIPLAFSAAMAAGTPLFAEEHAEPVATASMEAEAAMTPLEKWQADPTQVFDAAEIDLAQFQWRARPVVVFADSAADPRFEDQMALLLDQQAALVDRDVVLITDTDPAARSDVRLALRPRGFQLTLIGKDGGVKLRKPFPWDVRELGRVIDKMPMRQQELRDSRLGN